MRAMLLALAVLGLALVGLADTGVAPGTEVGGAVGVDCTANAGAGIGVDTSGEGPLVSADVPLPAC